MARQIVATMVDDLDGSLDDVRVVAFTFDGVQYTIDLSQQNRLLFEEQMRPWVKAARRHRGNPATRGRLPHGEAAKIRAWAEENGMIPAGSGKGRPREAVIRAYMESLRQKAGEGK